eukprot:m.143852 g.143852  ORF g.143852 m.143852 type:complete len:422 (-) comp14906_c0_seq10:1588-2853(-)
MPLYSPLYEKLCHKKSFASLDALGPLRGREALAAHRLLNAKPERIRKGNLGDIVQVTPLTWRCAQDTEKKRKGGLFLAGSDTGDLHILDSNKPRTPTVHTWKSSQDDAITKIIHCGKGCCPGCEEKILTGFEDSRLKLWNVNKENCERQFNWHDGSITACDMLCDKPLIASAALDRILCIWNSNERDPVFRIPSDSEISDINFYHNSPFHILLGRRHNLPCLIDIRKHKTFTDVVETGIQGNGRNEENGDDSLECVKEWELPRIQVSNEPQKSVFDRKSQRYRSKFPGTTDDIEFLEHSLTSRRLVTSSTKQLLVWKFPNERKEPSFHALRLPTSQSEYSTKPCLAWNDQVIINGLNTGSVGFWNLLGECENSLQNYPFAELKCSSLPIANLAINEDATSLLVTDIGGTMFATSAKSSKTK